MRGLRKVWLSCGCFGRRGGRFFCCFLHHIVATARNPVKLICRRLLHFCKPTLDQRQLRQIGFLGKALIDKDKDGIPDEFEGEEKKG